MSRPIPNPRRLPETPHLASPTDAHNPGEEFLRTWEKPRQTSTFAEPSNIQQSNIRCRARRCPKPREEIWASTQNPVKTACLPTTSFAQHRASFRLARFILNSLAVVVKHTF